MTTPVQISTFSLMTKPIGPICNLDCEYCFYLHKDQLYDGNQRWRMDEATLERSVREYIEAQPESVDEITFAWQGGEPTLMGLEFFQRVISLQRQYASPGRKIANSLQTNGVLLDDAWCEFLRSNGFLVGLSVDGPAELHDRYRKDRHGRPTFANVLRALKLLQKHAVDYNVLVAVNRANGSHGRRVYTYLRDSGVRFLQFIPIVERRGEGAHAERLAASPDSASDRLVSSRSVLAEQYGDFLIEVFDHWVRRDVGRVFVQTFEEAVRAWLGIEPALCLFQRRCGRALVLEHNGDVYSCDHFVDPQHRLGNLHQSPLLQLANSEQQTGFGLAKERDLPSVCRECDVRFVCNGECPKNRFIRTPDGESGLNYLCAGYKKFFRHIGPLMQAFAEEIRQGRPATGVMHRLQAEQRSAKRRPAARPASNPSSTGRNDPCPCGSGKKYKRCCMKRAADR